MHYENGYTCSQAVFSAYSKEMEIDEVTALRLAEGFTDGIGGLQNICGGLSAAIAVISYHYSDGTPGNLEKRKVLFTKIKTLIDEFQKEYKGITCKEVLRNEKPVQFQCGMTVKNCVLLINQLLSEIDTR